MWRTDYMTDKLTHLHSVVFVVQNPNGMLSDHVRSVSKNRTEVNKKATQLSGFLFVENTGVEPVTSCLPGKRSSQLS
jgi:hypothetical protein